MSIWLRILFVLAIAIVVADGVVDYKRSVHAETKPCHYIFVRTASDAYLSLYSDASLIMPIPNPFVVTSDKWEIHTSGVRDLKIEERPCR